MTRLRTFLVRISAILLLSASVASAQLSTAQVSGRVTDESGAVLPGVTVTMVQTDTGLTRETVTDADGAYVLPNLPTGPYRLEVALAGFRTYQQTGIVLTVNASPVINASLAVGAVEETVSVEAAAPLVDVQSAGIGEVVGNERIVELPLQGRQVTDLIVIAGAAVQTDVPNSRTNAGGVNIAVAGGLPFGVGYVLDGATHNNPQSNVSLPLPFPDALQEFRVATSGLSAQNGMKSAASVNMVTKSGTNAFHGNAFEFLRHRALNATSPFAGIGPDGERQDDGLLRNQFGGTLGGPIVRDRLFFFGAYQGTALRVRPSDQIAFVPTAAMLAGDFTAFASPACNAGRQLNLTGGFVNNRIDPALFSPAGVALARRLPATTDPCGLITFTTNDDSDEGQFVGRGDYQVTTNHSIFSRYMFTYVKEAPAYQGGDDNVLKTFNPGLDNNVKSFALGDTMVFGPTMVNSLRFAMNKTKVDRYNTPFFDPTDLGIDLYSYTEDQMVVDVTGAFRISQGPATKAIFFNDNYQVADDFTLVRGSHQFGFGGSTAYWRGNYNSSSRTGGNWIIDGRATGSGLSDLLMGRVTSLEHGGPALLLVNNWYLGLYAQDTWRATNRLTFNYGLRWEPYFGQNVENNAISIFNMENFRNGVKSTVFVNAPAGLIYPGDPGFPEGQTGLNKQWWNLSPRIGAAWDVSGDGRTAVRASYAMAYDFMAGDYHNINSSAPPFGNRSLITDPPGRMDRPYAAVGGNPHPIVTDRNTQYVPFGAFGTMDPDINSPRVQNWNVTVEKQIGSDWGASASYLGSYSDRLWAQQALNPGVYMGLGPCTINGVNYPVCSTNANLNQRRVLFQQNPREAALIGALDLNSDVGSQEYHGLRLSMQRRAATGLSLNANYTISRCLGTPTTNSFNQTSSGYLQPDNPDYDRGYCDQDRTHLATVTLGAETPEFDNGVLRAVVSGWRASGIVSARSGKRLNIVSGRDNAFTGITAQRVDVVSDDLYGDSTLVSYFNRAAFAQPAPGAHGNMERNGAVGPKYFNVDLALAKLIGLGSSQNVELRVETFNLFNTFNWGDPNVNFNSGQFGRITTQSGSPRIIQLGIKYAF
jgi:hypothetical protein